MQQCRTPPFAWAEINEELLIVRIPKLMLVHHITPPMMNGRSFLISSPLAFLRLRDRGLSFCQPADKLISSFMTCCKRWFPLYSICEFSAASVTIGTNVLFSNSKVTVLLKTLLQKMQSQLFYCFHYITRSRSVFTFAMRPRGAKGSIQMAGAV